MFGDGFGRVIRQNAWDYRRYDLIYVLPFAGVFRGVTVHNDSLRLFPVRRFDLVGNIVTGSLENKRRNQAAFMVLFISIVAYYF